MSARKSDSIGSNPDPFFFEVEAIDCSSLPLPSSLSLSLSFSTHLNSHHSFIFTTHSLFQLPHSFHTCWSAFIWDQLNPSLLLKSHSIPFTHYKRRTHFWAPPPAINPDFQHPYRLRSRFPRCSHIPASHADAHRLPFDRLLRITCVLEIPPPHCYSIAFATASHPSTLHINSTI